MNVSPPHPYGLTRKEAKLFELLSDGEEHTKGDILAEVIGRKFVSDALVPMHVYRLRRKLEPHGFTVVSATRRGAEAKYRLERAA